ncbi:hypothetical protein H0A71_06495 [Alcaligenaceae bacterium]|nr:hypothetical protein [Alcaligenaceae bacterium]
MTSIKITLPWPDMSLMPNRKNGKHWGGTQAAKVNAREGGFYATRAATRDDLLLGDTVPLRITFAAPDGRHRDLDNLLSCSKSALDGVAKALGIDDKRFNPITIRGTRDTNKVGYVQIQIGEPA